MKKRVFGRKFKKDIDQRKALFKNLMSSLILEGRIKTTEAKAKAIRGEVEQFVTKAKNKGEDARLHLSRYFNPNVVDKLILDVAPKFKNRPGGYTRILRMGRRVKDNAQVVMLEWVESTEIALVSEVKQDVKKETEIKKAEVSVKGKKINKKENKKNAEVKVVKDTDKKEAKKKKTEKQEEKKDAKSNKTNKKK